MFSLHSGNGNTFIDNKSKIEIMHQRLSKEIMKYEKAVSSTYRCIFFVLLSV